MLEAAVLAHAFVERVLTGVAEGRVAEVVRERDRLDQRFVERQRARDRARNLRHFERMRDARAVQVALVVDEHLGLVGEPAEGIAMDDAIAVALVFAAEFRRRLGMAPATRALVVRAVGREPGCGDGRRIHGSRCARSVACSSASG